MNIKKIIKDNLIFIAIILIGVLVLFKKDSHITMPVVSVPDDTIEFTSDNEYLEQTWLTNVKKIEQIQLPIIADTDINDTLTMKLCVLRYPTAWDAEVITVSKEISIPAGSESTVYFDVPTVKGPLGTKLWMIFSPSGNSEWKARVPIGTNHEGMNIDGHDTGMGAAVTFGVIKTNRLFWIYAILFMIIAPAFFLMTLFRRKFAECAGLGILINTLLLYLFGLFDRLEVGAYFVCALSVVLLILTVFFNNSKFLKKENTEPVKYIDYGFIAFLVVFAGMFVYYRNTVYTEIDEFVHWGIAVKDMVYYDSFANHELSTIVLQDYPPFAALYEYFYNFVDCYYSDKMAYMAYHIMAFVLLMPIMTKFTKKNKLSTVILCIVMLVIPCFMNEKAVNSIYIDSLLGIEFAYLLICYYMDGLENKFNILRIGAAVIALVLTKNMGLILAGLGILIIVFDYFMVKKDIRKSVIRLISLMLIMGITFISWQISLGKTYEGNLLPNSQKPIFATVSYAEEITDTNETLKAQQNETTTAVAEYSQSLISNIAALLKGNGAEYQKRTLDNFINRFFSGTDVTLIGFSISVFGLLVLIFVIGSCIKLTGAYGEDSDRMFNYGISASVAGLCYFGILLLFYLVFFSPGESESLKDYIRYASSFFIGILLTFLYLMTVGIDREPKKSGSVIALVLSCAFLISMPVGTYYDSYTTKVEESNLLYGFDNIAEILRSSAYKGNRTYFVCSNASSYDKYFFSAYACPLSVSYGTPIPIASEEILDKMETEWKEEGHQSDYRGTVVDYDEWTYLARQNEYFFLYHVDEGFKESFKDIFENEEDIKDGTIFRPGDKFTKLGEFGFITWK